MLKLKDKIKKKKSFDIIIDTSSIGNIILLKKEWNKIIKKHEKVVKRLEDKLKLADECGVEISEEHEAYKASLIKKIEKMIRRERIHYQDASCDALKEVINLIKGDVND